MLQKTSVQKSYKLSIFTLTILLIINFIKCQDDESSIVDGDNSNSDDNSFNFDLMESELERQYEEIQHKLSSEELSTTSTTINPNNSTTDDQNNSITNATTTTTTDQLNLLTTLSSQSDSSSDLNDRDVSTSTNNSVINLTTLIPDYVASAGINVGLMQSATNKTNQSDNEQSGEISQHQKNENETIDNESIDFDYESRSTAEMNDNVSSADDPIAFDMKQNVLYTEDLNHNDIKMRNLSDNHDDNTAINEFIETTVLNENFPMVSSAVIAENFDSIDEPEMLIGTTIFPSATNNVISASTQGTTTISAAAINRIKQGKQIQIEKNRIVKKFPHERLQQYIEDPYIRKPLAAIVDPTSDSLGKTVSLWRSALRPNTALDIILLGVNTTGVSVIYNFTNTRTFLAGLNSLKESDPGNPFFAILKATELIPYDSAIFLSAATIPTDIILGQQAGIALLKKRIRLYLLWFGDMKFNNLNESKETVAGGILGKISIRSGGEIFHMRNHDGNELEENMITLISDNFRGTQDIEIPVDSTISDLQIKLDTMMRTATLQTPTGEINLKKIMKLEFLKFLDMEKRYYEINVSLDSFDMQSNKLLLRLDPEIIDKRYCVSVIAIKRQRMMTFTNIFEKNLQSLELALDNFKERSNWHLTHENIQFPIDPDVELIDIETSTKKSEIIGNDFKNISKASQQVATLQSVTKIEMGLQSQVRVAPGMMAQLYFEVTNLRSEPIIHNILVTDEQKFLKSLSHPRIFLPPGETISVMVTVMVPQGVPQNTIDKITFTCQGNGQASLSVHLKVVSNQEKQDTTSPYLNWAFGTRCDGNGQVYTEVHCSSRFWNLEITAQDYDSGILRLTSAPIGIIYRTPFTVGTTELVRATYTANCCDPKVTISVYDLAGNQRTHLIDVRDIVLTEASIAAVVLGVILLILLIIGLIVLIVWCCKRRKSDSRDLPTYRSPPTQRTRE